MEEHDGLTNKTNKQNGGHERLPLSLSLSCSQVLAAPTVPSHTTITTSLQSHHQPPVKKDAADIVVRDGRLLGAGGHAERPQEVVDQDVELLDVLGLGLQHAEHHLVPLPHAFGVRGTDVVLDDGFPLPAANPASQETLDL